MCMRVLRGESAVLVAGADTHAVTIPTHVAVWLQIESREEKDTT